jgi:hypothetical protein
MGSDTGAVESSAVPSLAVDRWGAVVAVGDVAVVVLVLLYGELSHGINPITQPVWTAETVLPFLAGWVLAAGVLGIYDDRTTRLVPSLRTTAGAWLGAANVGLVARGSPYLHGGTAWPFPLVVTGFVLLGLLAWRTVVATLLSRHLASGPD